MACSTTPSRWPRRRASESFTDAIPTWRRRRRSGGAAVEVRLGDRHMGGRLVQAALDQVAAGPHQGQLGVIRARREGA